MYESYLSPEALRSKAAGDQGGTGGGGGGGPGSSPKVHGSGGSSGVPGAFRTEMLPSHSSFKVAVECPLPTIFLFQIYPQYHMKYINDFLPAMIDAISIEGPTPDEVPVGRMQVFTDFRYAQVRYCNVIQLPPTFRPTLLPLFWR
jgi:hypothetical protein